MPPALLLLLSEVMEMCLRDFLAALQGAGLTVRESKMRWAITSGKVSRPQLDGSLRFDFGQDTWNSYGGSSA